MDGDKTEKIINELLKEEEAENTLISIYINLLDLNIGECISEEKRAEYVKGIRILYEESVRHKEAIEKIFKKYNAIKMAQN